MHAIRQHRFGGPEVLVWEELPTPRPGPDEVLVEVHAAAVNHFDILSREGILPTMPLPRIVGIDCTGAVQEDPSGRLAPGTPVVILGERMGNGGPGAYATHVCVHGEEVFQVPEGMDLTQTAGLGISYLTAWHALVERAQVQPGGVLLIQGVGGGVASAALQLGVALGLQVWATTSSDTKVARALELGAERAFNYQTQDVVAEVQALGGAELILNAVGGDSIQQGLRALRTGGRLLSIGTAYGREFRLDGFDFLLRELTLLGVNISPKTAAQRFRMLCELGRLMAQGRLRVLIDRELPLSQAAEAHRLVSGHTHFGKVMLRP